MEQALLLLTDRLNQLSEQFRELREGVQKAIRIADDDPEMALTRARKVLEYVVRDVFEHRVKEPPGTRPLENLLQILVKDGHFPVRLDAYATMVRKLGNLGTHNFNETITSADVTQSLTQLMPILEWYFEEERPDAGISLGLAHSEAEVVRAQSAEMCPLNTPETDSAVIPKGLRSFDATDSDSFLRLLPGPRDKDGLPDSLRFWKQRVEAADELTFTVGVIYGPSGCGKSSLMKAGLIPRLSKRIVPIFVEATVSETEDRLLKGLRRRFRALPGDLALRQTVAALRQNQGLESDQKVLIVLDQFEQWLHAKRTEQDTELSHALRQCDGDHVQCIAMVRDDFWLALSRFMEDLDLRLVVGENAALIDLFDLIHARKVLVEFGRAFGRLPNDVRSLSKEQETFLKKVVDGLAQDGRVIPVRLALFAEMIKGRPWNTATLKEIGGTAGIGVTFLEETFNSSTLKHHQRAARPVLNALLPEQGSDIKGHMRSRQELLQASGYRERPKEFDDLIRILDNEVRLITPTDPEGAESDETRAGREADKITPLEASEPAPATHESPLTNRYYQLTHDYLVHSLRDWLNRKQKETRRGRAELRLADHTATWHAKPENRLLPSLSEYLWIRSLTEKKKWTAPQRRMMRKAGRIHGIRSGIAAAVLLVLTLCGVVVWRRNEDKRRSDYAASLVEQLVAADIVQVPKIVDRLVGYRRWAEPMLELEDAEAEPGSTRQLHTALALLSLDQDKVNYLRDQLLIVSPKEFPVVRDALLPRKAGVVESLWQAAIDTKRDTQQRFQAACALATYTPDEDRWSHINAFIAGHLVTRQASDFLAWREALRPAKSQLINILTSIYRDPALDQQQRSFATETLIDYAADETQLLVNLIADSEHFQFTVIFDRLLKHRDQAIALAQAELVKPAGKKVSEDEKEHRGRRQANLAVALYRFGKDEDVWPLLRFSPDPRARSNIVHWLAPLGGKPQAIIQRIDRESDVTIRRALVLMLGEFSDAQLAAEQQQILIDKLFADYETDPDAGLHSAAEWLLRKWGQDSRLHVVLEKLRHSNEHLSAGKSADRRQWYVNTQGQTFVILDGGEILMGSPKSEPDRRPEERQHRCRIGRRFAVSATEVTKAQYRGCQQAIKGLDLAKQPQLAHVVCTEDSPQTWMTWYEAAGYCNWLSRLEGLPECYQPNAKGEYGPGMKPKDKYLELSGYRLLTDAEWEYACRAGTVTSRYYGLSVDLLRQYAWYQANAQNRTWPVASRKPNDYGLFDMLGNAFEWVEDSDQAYSEVAGKVSTDSGTPSPLTDSVRRVLRGGGYYTQAVYERSANRTSNQPVYRSAYIGFRPARTYP
jgi:formylglycine-generating enzyme required for sulfatase activity